jgi:hypothetical protein
MRPFCFVALLLAMPVLCLAEPVGSAASPSDGPRWWKGNLHTHTVWSDGDQFPEVVTDWYHSNHYNFLVLSDHNVLSRGELWIDPSSKGTIQAAEKTQGYDVMDHYRARFGDEWIETRVGESGREEVRLKTLQEVRTLFEEPGRFLMIEGEEITDALSVHVIATNIAELIKPMGQQALFGDDSPHGRIVHSVNAVYEHRERTGQPMFPHLAHPNWASHITAEEILPVEKLRFFEVYNGHRGVKNYGDPTANMQHLERVWDIVLTKRLGELGLDVVYGLAVDDAHHYEGSAQDTAEPGRGWVMVQSRFLTPAHLIMALESGDFYSTTGVSLKHIESDDTHLALEVEPEEGVTYTIEFVGTRRGYDASSQPIIDAEGKEVRATRLYSDDIGQVLQTTEGPSASYTFTGDEIYVRAKVTSSKEKVNPFQGGEKEMAWVQPVVVRQ